VVTPFGERCHRSVTIDSYDEISARGNCVTFVTTKRSMNWSPITIPDLPSEIAAKLQGLNAVSIVGKIPEFQTTRFEKHGVPQFFLKTGSSEQALMLADEAERFRWMELAGLPVPEVVCFVRQGTKAFLLTAALSGSSAASRASNVRTIVHSVGDLLSNLHSTPTAGCPFNMRLAVRLENARRRVELNLVDRTMFDAEWQDLDPWMLLKRLQNMTPPEEDLVFTHGDLTLPNIILCPSNGAALVDVAYAGIADRHQDLALIYRSAKKVVGSDAAREMLGSYHLAPVNAQKINFYLLLDEFF
jgi:aminoglycoside 3'-phosphotransferase II